MADNSNVGVAAAIDALSGAAAGAPTQGNSGEVQQDFLDLDGPEGAESPVGAEHVRKRGPGRPPGSPNKRTEDLRRFVLSRFKHPVVALMEIGAMPAHELAAYLDCDREQALALQVRALAEAAPYVDSKMPQRIQVTDRDRLPSFGLEFAGGTMSVTDPAGNRISLSALALRAKGAMAQRLIEGEAIRSQTDGSHEERQANDPLEYSGP